MSFSGRVEEISHMRGLLVSFEGRSPNLGDTIRVKSGKILGRVDTVIGPVDSGFVHIHPVSRSIEVERAIGSPVEIAPRRPREKRGGSRHRDGKKPYRNEGGRTRDGGRKRDDGRNRRGSGNSVRKGDSRKRGGSSPRGRSPRYDGRGSRKSSRGRGRR